MHKCVECEREIAPPSPIATYENKYYHPECLRCSKCSKSLSGKQFIKEKSGALMCEECNEKYAPKCKKCGLSFGAGQSYKKINDYTYYHNECFKCAGPCRKPIAAEFYDLENGKFICTDCYDKYGTDYDNAAADGGIVAPPPPTSEPPQTRGASSRPSAPPPASNNDKVLNNLVSRFDINLNDKPASSNKPTPGVESLPAFERKHPTSNAPPPADTGSRKPAEDLKCAKCGLQLTGTFTVFNEQKYHTKCFVCCQCGQEFSDKSFFKLNGQPLCRTCHSKNLVDQAARCKKCSQPILDTVVTFKNNEYHDYCLVCTECTKKLVGQSIYTDKQERPFCVDCFTRKEGKTCGKCSKIIAPNQSNLVFEGKNFHKECFTCTKCSRQISSSESFYRSDDGNDGIICESCINKP